MRLLSRELDIPVLTLNDLGLLPIKRMGRYLIVNGRYLRPQSYRPLLAQLNGAFFYPFVKLFERRHDSLFLTGGIDSGFLRYLDLGRCVLFLNTIPFGDDDPRVKTFARRFAPRLRAIVAQSLRVKERLLGMGVPPGKVHLVYPWVDMERFVSTPPPDTQEFRFLFASAPNMESEAEDVFTGKGLPLLLEAFREFTRYEKASLHILWRGYYNRALTTKIRELGLEERVEVINGVVETPPLFARCHATVVPFIDLRRSPEVPLSAVESLACGRPVVATGVMEMAHILREHRCGCVVKPSVKGLLAGLLECRRNYAAYQGKCRSTAEKLFALDTKALLGLTGLPERAEA
jgi:glycosyltransferase involved in cell wall biosynthesis